MENRIEEGLEVLKEYLDKKQYVKMREWMSELNDADIAIMIEELEEEEMLKVFRILPKDMSP